MDAFTESFPVKDALGEEEFYALVGIAQTRYSGSNLDQIMGETLGSIADKVSAGKKLEANQKDAICAQGILNECFVRHGSASLHYATHCLMTPASIGVLTAAFRDVNDTMQPDKVLIPTAKLVTQAVITDPTAQLPHLELVTQFLFMDPSRNPDYQHNGLRNSISNVQQRLSRVLFGVDMTDPATQKVDRLRNYPNLTPEVIRQIVCMVRLDPYSRHHMASCALNFLAAASRLRDFPRLAQDAGVIAARDIMDENLADIEQRVKNARTGLAALRIG